MTLWARRRRTFRRGKMVLWFFLVDFQCACRTDWCLPEVWSVWSSKTSVCQCYKWDSDALSLVTVPVVCSFLWLAYAKTEKTSEARVTSQKLMPKYWRNESWKIMEQWSIFFHSRIVVQEIHRWAMRRMLRTAHCGNFGGGWEVWLVEIARTTTSRRCWLILAWSWYQWCWSKGKNQWKHSKQSIGLLILGWVWWHMSDYRSLWDVHNILLHCQHILKKIHHILTTFDN